MAQAQGQVQNLGPVGERVAENLRRQRGRMKYRELSDRLTELGRPIPVLGLSRIESGARRVDVDDLIALALALDVAPATLLMPAEETEKVELTANRSTDWQGAWRWTNGETPLGNAGGDAVSWTRRVQDFIRENRPYEDTPTAEAIRYVKARWPGLRVDVRVDSLASGIADPEELARVIEGMPREEALALVREWWTRERQAEQTRQINLAEGLIEEGPDDGR